MPEYRIEDLAHHSGTTVRTIRAYQDRGLLPRPERRGRSNVYGEPHLARLHQIAGLLDRGYTLASIKELLEAWDAGRGLDGVLGLVAEVDRPWTDEQAERITRADLDEKFGGIPDDPAVEDAVRLGVLIRVPDTPDEFLVPSPRELAVAAELHASGVPLSAVSDHLRELRVHVEHIAGRFLDFTTEYLFHQYLDHPPTDEEATEATALVRRLRPLAQQAMDAELARAMRTQATRHLRHHLEVDREGDQEEAPEGEGTPYAPQRTAPRSRLPARKPHPRPACEPVQLPATTVEAVRALVGEDQVAAFIAAAAEREVQARRMDAMRRNGRNG
ncbi:MerR family transcriptional regulator [Streptomyces sp. UNOC14_S4]|uniref:MerR family transcriptional regulator n=1 Tax=Streptomyces sp. UNOC14_S4 TaxID=2872340 RepID=UPI001E3773EE|nr:MerR family transcriptional regulator [Streptomyces sp. UNOC14_S4]MCC3766800.1 MerR family transcriptional regulator [Streptomyces sp. UNOC14_S4]